MKVVHEIYGVTQSCGGSVRPYSSSAGELPVSGYLDEILICSLPMFFHDEENLRIEGDLAAVYGALQSALRIVETAAAIAVKDGKLSPEWKELGGKLLMEHQALSDEKSGSAATEQTGSLP